MKAEELACAGLTKHQAEVYLELVKNPGQTAGKIAKTLSIDRTFAYGIINSLIHKGLVNHVTNDNKKVFFASDPDNLLKDAEEKHARISVLVKSLKSIKRQTKEEKHVRLYEGKSGLKAYVRDFLRCKEFFTLGGGEELSILEELKYQYPQYVKELAKKKITGKIITSAQNEEKLKRLFGNSKVVIKNIGDIKNQASFAVFQNKVAIYSAGEASFAIIIEDKNISSALKAYFDILWKRI